MGRKPQTTALRIVCRFQLEGALRARVAPLTWATQPWNLLLCSFPLTPGTGAPLHAAASDTARRLGSRRADVQVSLSYVLKERKTAFASAFVLWFIVTMYLLKKTQKKVKAPRAAAPTLSAESVAYAPGTCRKSGDCSLGHDMASSGACLPQGLPDE